MDITEKPSCPTRLTQGKLGMKVSGIWDYVVSTLIASGRWKPTDLLLLGEYCRVVAACDDLWEESAGNEVLTNSRGNAIGNPATKFYLDMVKQTQAIARQLGLSQREAQSLERGELEITLLRQKAEGADSNELSDFSASANITDFD